EALWASTRALALLREHGLKTSREAWEAEGLPAHAELTEAGLNFAASRVELLLLNMEGEEASGIDVDEGPRRPMLAGEFVPGSPLHEEPSIHSLPTSLSLQLLGLPGPYSATDVAATESCREALQSQVSAAFSPSEAIVHLVGSRLYGAALEGADVDVVVELSPDIQEAVLGESDAPMAVEDRCRLLSSRSVLRLQRHFEGLGVRSDAWHRIEAVLDTRRPLLRLYHSPPGHAALKVEVGFDPSLAAVRKSSMLSSLEGPSLALARLVRQWTSARRLAGQQAGYPSGFAWCLLAVFYCQVRGLEPPLGRLSPHDRIDGRFRKPVVISEEALSEAAALLPGFFAFYAEHFRWTEEVVSTRLGRRTFRALQPSLSSHKVLCIEDPLEPDSDLAAAYLSAGRDRRLRAELRRAKRLLGQGPGIAVRDGNDIDLWAKCFRLRRDV
ncbi:URT1, partial [Symbiodinium necroappetens]